MPMLPSTSPTVTPSLQRSGRALEETGSLLEELACVFQARDDMENVRALSEVVTRVNETTRGHRAELEAEKEQSRKRIKEAIDASTPAEAEDAHQSRMEMLDAEKKTILESIVQLEDDCANSNGSLLTLTAELEKFKVEQKHLQSSVSEVSAMRKQQISLYANVSQLKLDFSSPPDVLRGFIADARRNQVHPFEYRAGDVSDFEMINELWNVIGGAT
mmetsp:Transcript_15667/g.33854  ORF Transcript_15667/g.33854 Transcript_15667/m.33854 type:complete len:217 (+) Transcript_15667:118-768(+)